MSLWREKLHCAPFVEGHNPLLSDPRDDIVLETGVGGRANLLVTFNQRDFVTTAKGFAHQTVRPSEALDRLRAVKR